MKMKSEDCWRESAGGFLFSDLANLADIARVLHDWQRTIVVSLQRRFRADALSEKRRTKSKERQAIFDFLLQQFQGPANWRKMVF